VDHSNVKWSISPGVRSTCTADGAALVDPKVGHYYTLNGVAARVWVTIETSPSGIAAEDIVDLLETHFEVPREELERDTAQCLADLQLAGLAGEKVIAGDESSADRVSSSSQSGARVHESGHEGGRTMVHEQDFVQRFETVESLIDQLFPQTIQGGMDWRAKKLKDFIDNAPGKVHGNLGDVRKELELSLSDSQARRLFKKSTGISIKEYARKRRLVLAAKQLQNTDQPIKVVATEAGYQTSRGFEKGFANMFRLTPLEFRRMWHRSQVTA